ncbi:MAG: cytidylate kinase family protein [Syntrophaceae bacterium]|nr:cytidylate kinase family protein [Syntrophaceae bacterium]
MYFITFSRKIGTNGTEIAKQVANQLGYQFYDTEAIENAAREMGFLKNFKAIDEKAPSLFQRLFSHKPAIELDRLNSIVYELAKRGSAVFLGRGSHILLKAFNCALHIRVTASIEKRIENLIERGFSREGALKAIERSDHERSTFIKFAFGVDWENPELYDVILNMDKLSVQLAVSTVIQVARSDEIKACSIDAIKSLEMMSLNTRLEASLIEAGLTYGPAGTYIEVKVEEPGKVTLTGMVDNDATKKRAQEITQKVKGVSSVENRIMIAPADRHA